MKKVLLTLLGVIIALSSNNAQVPTQEQFNLIMKRYQEANKEMLEKLTPEQKIKFSQMQKSWTEKYKEALNNYNKIDKNKKKDKSSSVATDKIESPIDDQSLTDQVKEILQRDSNLIGFVDPNKEPIGETEDEQ
jgi:hypothetical protein